MLLLVAIACGDDATAVPTTAPAATTGPAATTAPAATTGPAATTAPRATTAAPTVAPQPTAVPVVPASAKLGKKLTVALNSFDNEIMDPPRSR